MSYPSVIFESHSDYKLDPKFRVSIPVAWRPPSEEVPIRLLLSQEHKLPVIKVFSQEAFDEKFVTIEASDLLPAVKQQIVGALRMNSHQATINAQGKLTVPKDWAERIGLKADGPVVLAGRGGYYFLSTKEIHQQISEIEFGLDDAGLGVL
jgi:DNA-binding transcriptional regulator/RsmH inhibitor MraZ